MRSLGALVLVLLSTTLASAQEAPVPPVMVVAIAGPRVDAALRTSVETMLVDALVPMAGGRPIRPLAQEELRARYAACADAACQGAMIAELGAIGAVVVHLTRTGGRTHATLDLVDPISGTPRLPQQSADLDASSAATVLAPLIEAWRPAMFSPPPAPPTLLVTVNVDGATIAVDGVEVGHSPIAAQRLTAEHHVVTITAPGYAGTQRSLDLTPGQQARIDVNLSVLEGTAAPVAPAQATDPGPPAPPQWYEEAWIWAVIGAGVVVVAGVIVGVVIGTQPQPQPDPMGIGLPALRF